MATQKLNEDLDYVYLAPEIHWRGGRVFRAEHCAGPAPRVGLLDCLIAPEPVPRKSLPLPESCASIPSMLKQIIPARVKRVNNRMRAPRE